MTPRGRPLLRWGLTVGAAAALGLPPARAVGETSGAAVTRIVAALEAPEPAVRARAFADLDTLLVRDAAACEDALVGLKDVLKRRGGAERARVARRLLRLPGGDATETWWRLFDPVHETDDRVLEAAIEAIADRAKDPALARRLLDRARDPKEDPCRRALAVEAMGVVDSPAARLVLDAARPGADWIEESCRALGLARRGGEDAIPPLIALLGNAEVAPRVHAWESLVRLTHANLPAKRGPWEAWWKARATKAASAAPAGPPGLASGDPYAGAEPAHVPRYYGIPLRGKADGCHAVFCLDVSGSMSEHGIEPARAELRATLLACTTRDAFDVVAFDDRVLPWAGRLVRAHPVQKAHAIAWVEAIVPKSYTNLYDAVEAAFQYMGRGRQPSPEPTRLDAVFLLSDGAPNRGRYVVAKQVVAGIAQLSEGQVPVHTIGMGEAVLPLLKDIAQATGGRFVVPTE